MSKASCDASGFVDWDSKKNRRYRAKSIQFWLRVLLEQKRHPRLNVLYKKSIRSGNPVSNKSIHSHLPPKSQSFQLELNYTECVLCLSSSVDRTKPSDFLPFGRSFWGVTSINLSVVLSWRQRPSFPNRALKDHYYHLAPRIIHGLDLMERWNVTETEELERPASLQRHHQVLCARRKASKSQNHHVKSGLQTWSHD